MATFSRENLYNPATTRNPLIYLFSENPQPHKLLFVKKLYNSQKIVNVFNELDQNQSNWL